MGKYAATTVTHLSQVQVARVTVSMLRDLRGQKPDLVEEATELAIQLASGLGMAPPDLEPREEEFYGSPHDENAVAALTLLAVLAPGFADHMADVIGNW